MYSTHLTSQWQAATTLWLPTHARIKSRKCIWISAMLSVASSDKYTPNKTSNENAHWKAWHDSNKKQNYETKRGDFHHTMFPPRYAWMVLFLLLRWMCNIMLNTLPKSMCPLSFSAALNVQAILSIQHQNIFLRWAQIDCFLSSWGALHNRLAYICWYLMASSPDDNVVDTDWWLGSRPTSLRIATRKLWTWELSTCVLLRRGSMSFRGSYWVSFRRNCCNCT